FDRADGRGLRLAPNEALSPLPAMAVGFLFSRTVGRSHDGVISAGRLATTQPTELTTHLPGGTL
ncbi:MAG TPA: hypothetical protein VJY33_18650, partial [Isosphaeraceae bacterium]|nr:hypothetical protein [Isosphaeraceae bacterium]